MVSIQLTTLGRALIATNYTSILSLCIYQVVDGQTFAFVAYRIAAMIAFVLFLDAAAVNASGYYVKCGIYADACVLALAAMALGITSFVTLRRRGAGPRRTQHQAGCPAAGPRDPSDGPMGQLQFPPAQAYVQPQVLNGTLQYPPVEAPQVGVDIPVVPRVLPTDSPLGNVLRTAPPAAPPQGSGLSTVIRNEFSRATIRLAGKAAVSMPSSAIAW
jgi:hypothetical protein